MDLFLVVFVCFFDPLEKHGSVIHWRNMDQFLVFVFFDPFEKQGSVSWFCFL